MADAFGRPQVPVLLQRLNSAIEAVAVAGTVLLIRWLGHSRAASGIDSPPHGQD